VEAAERERLLDDERRRIAQELHDRVAQTLFSIGLTAQAAMDSNGAAAHKGMAKSTNGAPGANGAGTATDNNATAAESPERAALQSIRSLSAVGNEQMREAIFALTHGELPERGLARNLWHTVRDFRERTGLDADLVLAGKEPRLSQEAAEALLAAAREALANVEQHAHATSAVVSLRTTNSAATLVVQDDGVGPRPLVLRSIGSSTRHFGLRGVRDRVRALGGSFTVRRGEDGGFVLRVRVAT
jgi:signal transduction histidine kinase